MKAVKEKQKNKRFEHKNQKQTGRCKFNHFSNTGFMDDTKIWIITQSN